VSLPQSSYPPTQCPPSSYHRLALLPHPCHHPVCVPSQLLAGLTLSRSRSGKQLKDKESDTEGETTDDVVDDEELDDEEEEAEEEVG
jgi:hypothetical protein